MKKSSFLLSSFLCASLIVFDAPAISYASALSCVKNFALVLRKNVVQAALYTAGFIVAGLSSYGLYRLKFSTKPKQGIRLVEVQTNNDLTVPPVLPVSSNNLVNEVPSVIIHEQEPITSEPQNNPTIVSLLPLGLNQNPLNDPKKGRCKKNRGTHKPTSSKIIGLNVPTNLVNVVSSEVQDEQGPTTSVQQSTETLPVITSVQKKQKKNFFKGGYKNKVLIFSNSKKYYNPKKKQ